MSDRRKQPGRAAMPPPANAVNADVYHLLGILARVTRRIVDAQTAKERKQP